MSVCDETFEEWFGVHEFLVALTILKNNQNLWGFLNTLLLNQTFLFIHNLLQICRVHVNEDGIWCQLQVLEEVIARSRRTE